MNKKTIRDIMTAVFGLAALVILIFHLAHWWTMHNAIAEWSAALTERVIADSRLASVREEHRNLRSKLNDCRTMLAYKSGDADKALERRIAEQVAELEAGERAEAARRAEASAEMEAEAKTISRRYSEATSAVQKLLRSSAHDPESVQIQKWGDFIRDGNPQRCNPRSRRVPRGPSPIQNHLHSGTTPKHCRSSLHSHRDFFLLGNSQPTW